MGVELAHLMAAFAALEAVERLRVPCEGCGVEGGGERTMSSERREGSGEEETGSEEGNTIP